MPELGTIAFAMLPELGHHLPTFALSRALRERGHDVVYLGLADLRAPVEREGFRFVTLLERELPEGYLERLKTQRARRSGPRVEEPFAVLLRQALRGAAEEWLEAAAPDLLVADSLLWFLPIVAHGAGIPSVLFSTDLTSSRNAEAPPVTSAQAPGRGATSRTRIWLAWERLHFARRWAGLRQRLGRQPRLDAILAEAYGFPGELFDAPGEYGLRLRLPELVACPEAFDFRRTRPLSNRRYLGGSIDLRRDEAGFPWDRVTGDNVLYCTLGTGAHFRAKTARHLYGVMLEVATKLPSWQVVLHADSFARELRAAREAVVVETAPQLALLARARVAVHHGGLGTVKECLYHGVPMVVIPLVNDQPGNAARVAHHGLGVVAAANRITSGELARAVERLAADPAVRGRLAAMRDRCRDPAPLHAAVARVESLLVARDADATEANLVSA